MKRQSQGTGAAIQGNPISNPVSQAPKSALGTLTLCPISADGPGHYLFSPAHKLPLGYVWKSRVGGGSGYEDTILQRAEQINKDRILSHHTTSDKSCEPK